MGEYGWAIGIGIIVLAASLGRALRPLGRALAGWLERRDTPSSSEVATLRVELDQVRRQLAEVEERLDFAERLLAQPREPQPRTIIAPENT